MSGAGSGGRNAVGRYDSLGPRGPYLNLYEWLRLELGMPPAATYGDWVGDHGFFSTRIVREQVERWRTIFEEERPDLVGGATQRNSSPATPAAMPTPRLPSTESGCSATVLFEPPTSALAPTPAPTAMPAEAPP
jgi:hypothetical protein